MEAILDNGVKVTLWVGLKNPGGHPITSDPVQYGVEPMKEPLFTIINPPFIPKLDELFRWETGETWKVIELVKDFSQEEIHVYCYVREVKYR